MGLLGGGTGPLVAWYLCHDCGSTLAVSWGRRPGYLPVCCEWEMAPLCLLPLGEQPPSGGPLRHSVTAELRQRIGPGALEHRRRAGR